MLRRPVEPAVESGRRRTNLWRTDDLPLGVARLDFGALGDVPCPDPLPSQRVAKPEVKEHKGLGPRL